MYSRFRPIMGEHVRFHVYFYFARARSEKKAFLFTNVFRGSSSIRLEEIHHISIVCYVLCSAKT